MWIHTAGFLSAALYVALGILTGGGSLPIETFLLIMLTLAAISFWAFRQASKVEFTPSLTIIIGWAVIFRIIGTGFAPIYEDDFYRYLWDAYQFCQNGTPYGTAPSDFFSDTSIPPKFQTILDGINYPDIPTIYGPVFQYSFLLSYLFFPGKVFGLQLIYACADILLIILLSKLTKRPALLLYAWCPLIIKEFAFTAHPDVLGVLLVFASIMALTKAYQKSALFLLALAVSAKIFALLLVPFILIRCKPRYWLVFPLTLGLTYAPFILFNTSDLSGLLAFAKEWQFNSSVFSLLLNWLSFESAKVACLLAFVSFYLIYAWKFVLNKKELIPRGDWLFGVFFLLSPVVNAWYLVWLLAFAAIRPSYWAWTASVTVLLSYVTGLTLDGGNLDLYQQPLWALLIQYGLILVALVFDLRHGTSHPPSQ